MERPVDLVRLDHVLVLQVPWVSGGGAGTAAKEGAMSLGGVEDLMVGRFRLSLRDRALWAADGKRVLKSRAFDLLLTLIEARDRVVGKDDLMRQVWGDIFVGENNLHVQIAAIRRALGDDSHYILTVPRKGYRFVGEAHPGAAADSAPSARLAAATARFWMDAGLAGEARSWLAGALGSRPPPRQADMLASLQSQLAALGRDRGLKENSPIR